MEIELERLCNELRSHHCVGYSHSINFHTDIVKTVNIYNEIHQEAIVSPHASTEVYKFNKYLYNAKKVTANPDSNDYHEISSQFTLMPWSPNGLSLTTSDKIRVTHTQSGYYNDGFKKEAERLCLQWKEFYCLGYVYDATRYQDDGWVAEIYLIRELDGHPDSMDLYARNLYLSNNVVNYYLDQGYDVWNSNSGDVDLRFLREPNKQLSICLYIFLSSGLKR